MAAVNTSSTQQTRGSLRCRLDSVMIVLSWCLSGPAVEPGCGQMVNLVGYALFSQNPEYVYLRQLYIKPESRRHGHAREAITWLWRNVWNGTPRCLRIDVLVGNVAGIAF